MSKTLFVMLKYHDPSTQWKIALPKQMLKDGVKCFIKS